MKIASNRTFHDRSGKSYSRRKEEVLSFNDLILEVSEYLNLSEDELNARMPQFYTDINVNGEFISLGENTGAYRNYAVDSINEVLTHENDAEDIVPTISSDGLTISKMRHLKKI